ncbi:MAG: cupin domain-containing protein [Acidobacteria bacterium]|nr:cupin domain-containing protein [Acidobacteriota bacterium]
MKTNYTCITDLPSQVEIPPDGILTRTLYADEQVKVILFGFDAGQELSEHTASMPAILHFLQGEARLTLGQDSMEAHAGTWVHMPANLQHSISAKTPVILLLLLLKQAKSEAREEK